jgi:four helix bundle protein
MQVQVGVQARPQYRGFRDLTVYKVSYQLALEIFEQTKTFPAFERYSLIDQIRRSSRSIVAHIAEAWRHRDYPAWFVSKLVDANGEAAETEIWLDMSRDIGYLKNDAHDTLLAKCDEVERMLHSMIENSTKFCR